VSPDSECQSRQRDGESTVADARRAAALWLVCAHGREVRETERERALAALDLSASERRAVSRLADRLVAEILSEPVSRLTSPDADEALVQTAEQLFGPHPPGEEVRPSSSR
jgi:glutamyl-tRNA reductase